MNSADRQKTINLLKQKVDLYEKLQKVNSLGKDDLIKYHQSLSELAKLQRVEACFQDIMLYAKTYFGGDGPNALLPDNTPSPDFHYELASLLRENALNKKTTKLVACAPRSHAKSTITSNIFLCWCACYSEDVNRRYWVLIGDKQATSAAQLATVKMQFEGNEKLIEDFGDMVTRQWNQLEIVIGQDPKWATKIQAAGCGEALRGLKWGNLRPSILGDDLEGIDNVSTPEAITKTRAWLDQVAIPMGDPQSSMYVVIGTILHYQSLLSTLVNERPDWRSKLYKAILQYPTNMHLWDEWSEIYRSRTEGETPAEASEIAGEKALAFYEEHFDEMNEGAKVLWPERIDLYQLMILRFSNPLAFATEYQNDPVDTELQVFKSYQLYKIEDINLEEMTIIGGIDPSLTETKRSDPSVIMTVAKSKTGIYYVVDVDERKRNPDKIIDDVLKRANTYEYKWITVETVQFQQFFASELRKRSAVANLYLNIKEYKSRVPKAMRIASIEPLVSNGYIRFLSSQTSLISQLNHFPRVVHDDCLDCLAQIIEQDRKKGGKGFIGKI